MRSQLLELTEDRIRRQKLNTYLFFAKLFAVMILLTIGAITLIRLDTIMTEQANLTYQIIVLQQDVEEMRKEAVSVDLGPSAMADEELELVCRVVAGEARGESFEGQQAVAQVIRDRSNEWGLTPSEVVLAPAQFAAPYNGEIPESVIIAVHSVFTDYESVLPVPTTHFHADWVDPYWASEKVCRGSIGVHRFYY